MVPMSAHALVEQELRQCVGTNSCHWSLLGFKKSRQYLLVCEASDIYGVLLVKKDLSSLYERDQNGCLMLSQKKSPIVMDKDSGSCQFSADGRKYLALRVDEIFKRIPTATAIAIDDGHSGFFVQSGNYAILSSVNIWLGESPLKKVIEDLPVYPSSR